MSYRRERFKDIPHLYGGQVTGAAQRNCRGSGASKPRETQQHLAVFIHRDWVFSIRMTTQSTQQNQLIHRRSVPPAKGKPAIGMSFGCIAPPRTVRFKDLLHDYSVNKQKLWWIASTSPASRNQTCLSAPTRISVSRPRHLKEPEVIWLDDADRWRPIRRFLWFAVRRYNGPS